MDENFSVTIEDENSVDFSNWDAIDKELRADIIVDSMQEMDIDLD